MESVSVPPMKVTTPHGFLDLLGVCGTKPKSLLQVFVQLGSLGKWET